MIFKRIFTTSASVLTLVFLLEIFLRFYYGFCDAVLVREDTELEYIAQPNQNRFRFRNHILYNSLSMRSPEIDSTSQLILGFGDSVINGGVQTDHDSLATTILSNNISKNSPYKIQFLNISYGSWGPDNCYIYLKRFGHFKAKSIFLFVSSHDAYDNINFDKVVDVHESFPSKQYTLAIYELLDRYVIPKYFPNLKSENFANTLAINKKKYNSAFNLGFEQFLNYCKSNNLRLVIYLHAEQTEQQQGFYNQQGLEIIDFAHKNSIDLITDIDKMDKNEYRDNIHINEKGQKKLASLVYQYCEINLFAIL